MEGTTRWAITGTPIQNKMQDFFALISFLKLKPFNELEIFAKYIKKDKKFGDRRSLILKEFIMLRRIKSDVDISRENRLLTIPKKSVQSIGIVLDEEERVAYEDLLRLSQKMFAEYLLGAMKCNDTSTPSKLYANFYNIN